MTVREGTRPKSIGGALVDWLAEVPWWVVIIIVLITLFVGRILASPQERELYWKALQFVTTCPQGQETCAVWDRIGVMLTLKATVVGYALALVLGLIGGLFRVSKNPVTYALSTLYVEVVRGIPLLVIIMYAGYVITPALRDATNQQVDLRGFPSAVLGLAFGYGAYLAEVFRAGIESIPKGQMEAARSLGMSYPQAMRYVILPQAIRVILPPLGNNFIAMLKDSSLISVIALPDLLQQGRLFVSRTFRAFEGYNTVALLYLLMTLILSIIVRLVERKSALPGRL